MTPNRDEASGMFPVVVLAAAILAADTSSAVIDMLGYQSATLLLEIGVGGITFDANNRIDFELFAGDLSDGSDAVAVTSDDVILRDGLAPATITNGIVRSLQAAHAAADVQRIGYVGAKRYLKLTADFSGTHGTGTMIGATLVRENAMVEGAA